MPKKPQTGLYDIILDWLGIDLGGEVHGNALIKREARKAGFKGV